MAAAQLGTLMGHIKELAAGRAGRPRTDRQLLDDFTSRGDGSAFAGLVGRHGPMVLRVCRRVLGHEQDAEDAFQATFLVLARNPGSIRRREALASWLYGVAYRTAMRAKRDAARRRKHEARLRDRNPPAAPGPTWDDVQAVLDEEVRRLPESLRSAFVLCVIREMTVSAAAAELGIKEGTLSWRLARARRRLRQRLARRGIELSALLAAGSVAASAGRAALPAALSAVTVRFGLLVAAGESAAGVIPAHVAALAAGVTRAMFLTRAKIAITVLCAVGLLAAGAGALARQALTPRETPSSTPKSDPPAERPPQFVANAENAQRMTIRGRVLDSEGKPLAGARVAVLAGVRRFERTVGQRYQRDLLGSCKADDDGRFELTVPRTSSLKNWTIDVLAGRAGYGLGWQSFDPDTEQPEAAVRVGRERVLRGRLIDLDGQPAAKVKLQVTGVHRIRSTKGQEARVPAGKRQAERQAIRMRKDVASQDDSVQPGDVPAGVPFWPGTITTDAQGRFAVRGVPNGMGVTLSVRGDRFAVQKLSLPDANNPEEPQPYRRVLEPARILEGRVTYADTGKAAVKVRVLGWGSEGRTDGQGRFRFAASKGPMYSGEEEGLLIAFSPDAEPYCNSQKRFQWPRGAVRHSIDIALPRGVLVRGKVTDEATGKPVGGAQVSYFIQSNKLAAEEAIPNNFANGRDMTATGPDGTFRIACRAAPGYLLIEGPDVDYVLRENGGQNRLFLGKRGGPPWRSHGFAALDPKPGAESMEVAVTLRKGRTIRGDVVGPDGQAVEDLNVFCVLQEGFSTFPVKVRGNHFELRGCDPEESIAAIFFDVAKGWGATAHLRAKELGDRPVRVRLGPCGSARVRFLNKEGEPLANFYPGLFLELAPKQGDVDADTMMIVSPFRKDGPHTNDDGYCTFSALIPGAKYRFGHADISTTFTAEAGKMVKVPDVVFGGEVE